MGLGRDWDRREGRFCLRNGKKGGCCARARCMYNILLETREVERGFFILTEMDEASSDWGNTILDGVGSAAEIRGMSDIISPATPPLTLPFTCTVLLLPCNRRTSDSPSYPFLLPLSFLPFRDPVGEFREGACSAGEVLPPSLKVVLPPHSRSGMPKEGLERTEGMGVGKRVPRGGS